MNNKTIAPKDTPRIVALVYWLVLTGLTFYMCWQREYVAQAYIDALIASFIGALLVFLSIKLYQRGTAGYKILGALLGVFTFGLTAVFLLVALVLPFIV